MFLFSFHLKYVSILYFSRICLIIILRGGQYRKVWVWERFGNGYYYYYFEAIINTLCHRRIVYIRQLYRVNGKTVDDFVAQQL